jgi:hypothetical protein
MCSNFHTCCAVFGAQHRTSAGMRKARETDSLRVSKFPFAQENDFVVKTASHEFSTAVPGLETVGPFRQVRTDNFPSASIDNLVSMCGTLNHQLRKYRQLNISLAKKRQVIAKAFNQIPQIEGHGSSFLTFSLDFDSVLSDIDEKSKRKDGKQRIDGLRKMNVQKEISCSVTAVNTTSKSGPSLKVPAACKGINGMDREDQIPNQRRKNGLTIRATLGDRILEELEQKLYETKKADVASLRNRELEVSYYRNLTSPIGTDKCQKHGKRHPIKEAVVKEERVMNSNRKENKAEIDNEFLNSLDNIFNEPLDGIAEMAGELEEAIGIIFRERLLSESEMMEIIESTDRDWSKRLSDNNVKDINNSIHNAQGCLSRKDVEIMKSDLSNPLFRYYQLLLSYPITSKKEELEILRSQHNNILNKTAQLCVPYSPYEFVIDPSVN